MIRILYDGPHLRGPQILDRFERRSHALIAVLLGFAAIIAQVRGFQSLVGIGISLSLLPPTVVAGIVRPLSDEHRLSAWRSRSITSSG